MDSGAVSWGQVRQAFRQIWGYEDFRPPQGEVVRTLLESRDALIVMPTGGGKSICFQLPALFQRGLTLVVSPLIALMENQVRELQQRQLPAAALHGELSRDERRQVLGALSRSSLRLLYLSPETLLSLPVWERICHPDLSLNGLILDEAHCLVQWGETFRPEYRRLGAVRPALRQAKPRAKPLAIAAFTATADPSAQQALTAALQLEAPARFCLSPYRPNLSLQVQTAWTMKCRRDRLRQFIRERPRQSGLVYVRSRRDAEVLAQWLHSCGYPAAAYHAGLTARQRRQVEEGWLLGRLPFVVCTSAFGLGIDKPDVRWIVHFHAPLLLSEYLQEVGRAGRDGRPSQALTLVSEPTGWLDPSDRQRRRFFSLQLQEQYQQARTVARQLPTTGNVAAIAREFPRAEVALSVLHAAGKLEWLDPFHYRLQASPSALTSLPLQPQPRQMEQYLAVRTCRWQFLLNAFGFPQEARGFHCRHCDNCHSDLPSCPGSQR